MEMKLKLEDNESLQEIPIDKIEIWENSRIREGKGDLVEIENLASDIKHRGLLQPVKVWANPKNEKYVLIFGNRRLEAHKMLGWKTIKAIVVTSNDLDFQKFLTDNLAENVHRSDLTPLEIARVCGLLLDSGKSIGEISMMTNIRRNRITESLKMISKVPQDYKKVLKYNSSPKEERRGMIPMAVANAISRRSEHLSGEKMKQFFEYARKYELTVNDVLVMKRLVTLGHSVEEAYQMKGDIVSYKTTLLFDRKEVEKYRVRSIGTIIKRIVSGQEKPNEKLILTKQVKGEE